MQRREAAFLALLKALSDSVYRIDRHGMCLDYRAEGGGDLATPPEAILARSLQEIYPREVAKQFRHHVAKAFQGGGIQCFEYKVPVDREVRHREVRIVATGEAEALVMVRDLTELKRAQEAARQLHATAETRALLLDTVHQVALDILTASETGAEALRHIVDAARMLTRARWAVFTIHPSYQNGLPEFVAAGHPPAGVSTHEQAEKSLAGGDCLNLGIARGDVMLGTLWLSEKEGGGRITEADEAALKALTAHAAVALHHLHLLTQQRALLNRLMEAQEEERRRIAYELHDGLTQYVMAAHAHLEAFLAASQSGKQEKASLELNQGLEYLKEAVVESRRLVNGLRPLALDHLGLARALEQLLAEERCRAGWAQADLEENMEERRFRRNLETAVYRVAQEALTNARKHAGAARVRVTLLVEEDPQTGIPRLSLEVRDWGRGIGPEQSPGGDGHLGLQSMRERVTQMGGSYAVWTVPGEGTAVRAVFLVADRLSDEPKEGYDE